MRRCWQAHVVDGKDAPGPIGIISKHVMTLGWSWHEFDYFERPGRFSLSLTVVGTRHMVETRAS